MARIAPVELRIPSSLERIFSTKTETDKLCCKFFYVFRTSKFSDFEVIFIYKPPYIIINWFFTSFLNRCTFFRYNVFHQIEVVGFLLEALSSFLRLAPLSL